MTADDWAEKAPQGVLARAAACRDGRSPARHAHDRRRRLDVGAAPAREKRSDFVRRVLLGETPEPEPETPEAEAAELAGQKPVLPSQH